MTTEFTWPSASRIPGDVVSATADWNPLVTDVRWLGGLKPLVKVRRTTTQTIPTEVETLIQFDGLVWGEWDWDMHNASLSSSRLTCPYDGTYRFGAGLRWDSATLHYYIQLRANGEAIWDGGDTRVAGTTAPVTDWGDQAWVEKQCYAGEYFEVSFWHDRGSSVDIWANTWAQLDWMWGRPS